MPEPARTLYLASASPRRRELLAQLDLHPPLLLAEVDESGRPGETPADYVERLARSKARAGWQQKRQEANALVLGADTAVVIDEEVLGKPGDRDEALEMLGKLSGRSHRVMTSVALCDDEGEDAVTSITEVDMRSINKEEMRWYWESGEPGDKAGAYAIQGIGAVFVKVIRGSYSGVVGLPLYETAVMLAQRGVILMRT